MIRPKIPVGFSFDFLRSKWLQKKGTGSIIWSWFLERTRPRKTDSNDN